MSYRPVLDQNTQFILQRWFYTLFGILTMIPIGFLTIKQIQTIDRFDHQLGFYLLILVQSISVVLSILFTAIFCRITDALFTTITILFLSISIGLHIYIEFFFNYSYLKENFNILTLRLGFVLIMLIVYLPWTHLMTHLYQINRKNAIGYSRGSIFSWFLNLDFMLMISLLILNIRSIEEFNYQQFLILSIGIPLVCLWLTIGKILIYKNSSHWFGWSIFYLLSFIQIVHLAHITYRSKFAYNYLKYYSNSSLLSHLIQTFIISCTNIFLHLVLLIISSCLYH